MEPGLTAAPSDRTPYVDRKTMNKNLSAGLLLGVAAAGVFALTLLFATLYIAS